jgi:tetratricopeptide (TPR) repeat protein
MVKPSQSRAGRPERARIGSHASQPVEPSGRTLATRQPLSPPLAPVGPSPEAIATFERATRALQQHDYRTALAQLGDLIERFPAEQALLDRARVYAALCERALRKPAPTVPETIEERLTAATAAVNNGNEDLAERLVALILDQEPDHELAYYLLAVIHARRGVAVSAIEALDRAMAISPDIRAQALYDPDFEALHDSEAFQQLLARPPAHSGTRRSSRPRSE